MSNKELREGAMQIFSQEELGSVRAFKENGEAWFSVKDVCVILDLKNTTHATENLDEDEKRIVERNDITLNVMSRSRGGSQSMSFINTSGLYTLIIRSRKPQAKAFKRWVTHVVLPSILEGKNSEGAFGYVYGQEDAEEADADPAVKAAATEALQGMKKLNSTIPVAYPPGMFAVINGMRMTLEEARNWDFD